MMRSRLYPDYKHHEDETFVHSSHSHPCQACLTHNSILKRRQIALYSHILRWRANKVRTKCVKSAVEVRAISDASLPLSYPGIATQLVLCEIYFKHPVCRNILSFYFLLPKTRPLRFGCKCWNMFICIFRT